MVRPAAGFIPALDGLRGIAIILVMLHHFTLYRPTSGIDALIGDVVFFFWTGVDLFFVLSGFLITGITTLNTGYMKGPRPMTFMYEGHATPVR